ncbi:hypothetical protein OEZ86_007778 [Tetradesmus obliquus]|nr:hypothetical protein OEZ86_007778 [Tetradesmus obliquus]
MSSSATAAGWAKEAWASLGSLSYKSLSLLALPSFAAELAVQALSGQQTPDVAYERLGFSTVKRPAGPVLWFHALSIGESAVALPVIFRCLLEYNEHVHVLLTTSTPEARTLLQNSLPSRVTVQFLPLDNVLCIRQFLAHWKPQACILMESPTWPALVECCATAGVRLALLNARLSSRLFLAWFGSMPRRALLGRMLGSFNLIVPQSDIDVGRFRILGATLGQMPGWCSDLKYAAALGTSVWHLWKPRPGRIAALRQAVAGRPMWVAAHTAPGEEEAVGSCHVRLRGDWKGLLTVLVPRTPSRCREVAAMLEEELSLKGVDVLLVDVPSELPLMYSVSEVAFVGNSLLEGCGGHNLAEAAVAGCAVLVGEHAGHFNTMADELNQAAIMAAEEASAAVNSSGPLEDPFGFHQANSGGGAATAAEPAASGPNSGLLSVLGEEQAVLLDGPSLSLPEHSGHMYGEHLQPGAPPPSAASSTPFWGTGEVTPASSSGGGTSSEQQMQQQLDGYFSRVMGGSAAVGGQNQQHEGSSSSQQHRQMMLRQQQQQRQQQLSRRRAMAGVPDRPLLPALPYDT